jgi:hypothetical protein
MKFPLQSLVWCSKLHEIKMMASWADMLDETLVTGLCRANPGLKYLGLLGDWRSGEDKLEIVFRKLQGKW